jgi:endonuclease YncB( thermonuclease family)
MQDTIYGMVDSAIDGDTIIIIVTEVGDSNQHTYNRWERIRITNIDAVELGSLDGGRDKVKLENAIKRKKVQCSVQSRDPQGRVVADVKII